MPRSFMPETGPLRLPALYVGLANIEFKKMKETGLYKTHHHSSVLPGTTVFITLVDQPEFDFEDGNAIEGISMVASSHDIQAHALLPIILEEVSSLPVRSISTAFNVYVENEDAEGGRINYMILMGYDTMSEEGCPDVIVLKEDPEENILSMTDDLGDASDILTTILGTLEPKLYNSFDEYREFLISEYKMNSEVLKDDDLVRIIGYYSFSLFMKVIDGNMFIESEYSESERRRLTEKASDEEGDLYKALGKIWDYGSDANTETMEEG